MITNGLAMSEQFISRASINSIINVLHDSLKKDNGLAKDLLLFLKERNINIPTISKLELGKLLPTTFNKINSEKQLNNLKNSLEGLDISENIL